MTAKTVLLRALGMLIGGLSLLVLGAATVSLESRLWMAPTLLGVVLLIRIAYDLYELDGLLAGATLLGLALSAMGVAALQSLSEGTAAHAPSWRQLSPDESASLELRALLFLALGLAAAALAGWRAIRALRAERSER